MDSVTEHLYSTERCNIKSPRLYGVENNLMIMMKFHNRMIGVTKAYHVLDSILNLDCC